MGINSLIAFQVYSLGFPVQIGWNRDVSAQIQHVGEWHTAIPLEFHDSTLSLAAYKTGFQVKSKHIGTKVFRRAFRYEIGKNVVFPAFRVTYDALPRALRGRRESLGVICRLYGL